jgi:hypothetical protein
MKEIKDVWIIRLKPIGTWHFFSRKSPYGEGCRFFRYMTQNRDITFRINILFFLIHERCLSIRNKKPKKRGINPSRI